MSSIYIYHIVHTKSTTHYIIMVIIYKYVFIIIIYLNFITIHNSSVVSTLLTDQMIALTSKNIHIRLNSFAAVKLPIAL